MEKKTIQLKHFKNDTIITEVKYEYIDIRDTLDIKLSPDQYYVCDSTKLKIELKEGYDYFWSPDTYLDTAQGNSVTVSPKNNITYKILAKHGNCQTLIDLPILFMPDNICYAHLLETGSTKRFSNYCASVEIDEPFPQVGTGENDGCISQDGWCKDQNKLENTLWYKVVVPNNGHLRIRVEGIDSQIALYSAPSCTELLIGNNNLIAANDDISTTNSGSEIDIINGLTPGDTLYLQLDGSFDGITGEFSVLVSDSPSGSKEVISLENKLTVTAFPNPANDFTNISIENCAFETLKIELFSQSGQLLFKEITTSYAPSYKTTIYTSNLKGLYILRVSGNKRVVNNKLIIL